MENINKIAEELSRQEQEQIRGQITSQEEQGPIEQIGVIDETQNSLIVKEETSIPVNGKTFEDQVRDNKFVNAMTNNEVAVQMARDEYNSLKNQKTIAKGIKKVAIDNTKTDIDSANIQVEEKRKNNKVKRQEISNELYRLKKERQFLEKEQKHRLEMQRAEQIREKYEDLLLRTCRKKQKGEDGKYHYINDENGKPIVNIPGKFRFFWIRLFDGIVSGLNQTAEILSALNKNVLKGGLIILILALLLIPPFREWVINLIGIKF